MSLEKGHLYEFGDFRLDLAEGVLWRHGQPHPVTPKVFQLLKILVEHHGHLIEKDKLISEIWAGSFVEEGNLTFTVRMLRKALNDSATTPQFIETVPRRGYRFIAKVTEIPLAEKTVVTNPGSDLPSLAKPKRFSRLSLPLAVGGLALLGTIIAVLWEMPEFPLKTETDAPILSAPFHSEKLTNINGIGFAVISPDGKVAAYANQTNGKYSIWLKNLETSENVEIVAPSENRYIGITFAHNGQVIYFVREPLNDHSQTAAYRIPISGGVPEKILDRIEGWISLSPDDRQISFVRCKYQEADFCSLFIADTNGQNEQKLLTRPMPFRISDNRFSPDGKSIAFAAGQSWNGASDFSLRRFNLADKTESEISPQKFFEIKSLCWLADGSDLLMTARQTLDGKLNIWRVSIADGQPQLISKDAGNYLNLSLDNRATRLIALQVSNNFLLYLFANGGIKTLTAAREATFAPDGKIIYTTNDGNIWSINREGGEQRQLTNSPFKDFSPRVSPDNRYIFFTSTRSGVNQVWRMKIDGSDQTQLTQTEGGYPRFVSPDGKWVYYLSGIHQTLWKIAAEGGAETQINEKRVLMPAFAPNGKLFASYIRDDAKRLKIEVTSLADKKTVKTFALTADKTDLSEIVWSNNSESLNYVVGGRSNAMWRQSLDESTPRFVADLGDQNINALALAPDNKTFVFVRGEWIYDAVLIDGLK